MRFVKDEDGQVLVMTVLSMAVLLGFVALAVDVGALFHAKRNLQIVADAAATAGALDYYKNGSKATAVSGAQTAAENAVTSNGLTSATFTTPCPLTVSGGGPQACVSIPATDGAHTENGSVEVQVVQPNNTSFMGYFGFGTLNVATRAVAGSVAGAGCGHVKNTLHVQGTATLCGVAPGGTPVACSQGSTCPTAGSTPACGIYAGSITGSGGGAGSNCIDARYVETPASSAGVNLNPSPAATNVPIQNPPQWVTNAPQALPASCPMPAGGTWTVSGSGSNRASLYTVTLPNPSVPTLTPGCYGLTSPLTTLPGYSASYPINMDVILQGASSASPLNLGGTSTNALYQFNLGTTQMGNGANAPTGGTLTLGSYINGGTAPSSTGASTTGVTLEVYTGNFTVTSTSTGLYLYAPNDGTSDTEDGVVLVEPPSNTGTINIQWGSAGGGGGTNCSALNFDGYIIALGATLTMQDQGGCALVAGFYVGNMNLNSTLFVENANTVFTNGPGKTISLVE